MLKIGLTGGIGSGKTTVAHIFEALGIPVFYADEATKLLMNTDPALKQSIIQHFGKESFENGELNRKYLAAIVFNDKQKLDLLNSLTHPLTIRSANEWMQKQVSPYVIKEAALLFESGSVGHLDYVIGVFAPELLRVQRVVKRDNLNPAEIRKRMERQLDENMKMKLCDFVLVNDEQQLLTPQVIGLHEKFLKMGSKN